MKVAIIGSRSFNDYALLKENLLKYKNDISMIVSGGAIGADSLGKQWADENSILIEIFYPDWKKFGKSAGYRRNVDIVKNSDMIIAFWDGSSKGTKHSIDIAESLNKKLIIIKI